MAYTTIDDPSAHFQTTLYTGNGSDGYSITNSGNSDLQPDMLWFKNRNGTQIHQVFDSSRGIANSLRTNDTDAEDTDSPNDRLTAINSDGFTLGDDGNPNTNTNTYVAWQWKANGGTETHSQTETGTSLACSTQANSTALFSITTYTGSGTAGDKITHGLGVVPQFHITKKRNGAEDWLVYHHKNTDAPETDHLLLNTNDATSDSDTRFNDTAPTSTLITYGNNSVCNGDAATYVNYAFAAVQGFSKFGGYVGNGALSGPFIYTGFKPAWCMIKRTVTGNEWTIFNHKSDPYNEMFTNINASTAGGEDSATDYDDIDFLSNGFKIREDNDDVNTDASTYIYMVFAEQPFVTSGGVPCTAR
jgi:hypothetical protein